VDGGAGGQTGAPVRASITSNEKTKAKGKRGRKGAIYRDLFYNLYDCANGPVTKLVTASKKKKKRKGKRTRLQKKRNRDDGGKKRTSC
jgi:hypothetical protein